MHSFNYLFCCNLYFELEDVSILWGLLFFVFGKTQLLRVKVTSYLLRVQYLLSHSLLCLRHLKCPYRQIFLLAILILGTISILPVQKFFDLDRSFVFYGRLKLALGWTFFLVRHFCDVIQGSRLVPLINLYSLRRF